MMIFIIFFLNVYGGGYLILVKVLILNHLFWYEYSK